MQVLTALSVQKVMGGCKSFKRSDCEVGYPSPLFLRKIRCGPPAESAEGCVKSNRYEEDSS